MDEIAAKIKPLAFGASAALGLIVSLFNGIGRVVLGAVYDRFGHVAATYINTAIMFGGGIFLVIAAKYNAVEFILCGLIFVGTSYGGCPTIIAAFINESFGQQYYPTNFTLGNMNLVIASIVGPTLSASLLKISGGNYTSNFYAVIGFTVLSLVACIMLNNENLKG